MSVLDSSGLISFFARIIRFDYWLFSKINRQWTNSWFDALLPYFRESEIWVPFYLFLLVFITLNFGKKGWQWAFTLIMTGIISDLVCSHLLKDLVFRYRPCDGPDPDKARFLVNYCPSSSSFPSSHACNHFAVAMFVFLTLRQISPWWGLIFVWAFSIAYAQVYVGVHYPLDVASGTILGCGIGYGMSVFFRKQLRPISLIQ